MAQDAARAYWRFSILWLIVGCSLGTLCAVDLLSPGLLSGHPVLGFGRLVAAHRVAIIHGAMFSAVFGVAYTLLPRLAQDLPSPRPAGLILAWAGLLILVVGIVGVLWGQGSGLEYSDLPNPAAFLFWLYLVGVAADLGFLAARSRALKEHPSFGLILAASIVPAVVYPFTLPDWWGVGLFSALRVWIGWRAVFLGSFVLAALGASLWTLGSGRSGTVVHRAAYIVGIALFAGFTPFLGIVHLLDAPIPASLKAWGAFSGAIAGAALLLLVLAMWRRDPRGLPAFLALLGLAGLAVVAVQGVLMVLRPIHSAFHFTSNTSAHAHLALGAIYLLFLGCALVVAPRLGMRRLHRAQAALPAVCWFIGGLLLVFFFQTSAGIVQVVAFRQGLSPTDWLASFRWLQLGVFLGGIAAVVGSGMLGWIVVMTTRSSERAPMLSRAEQKPPEPLSEGGER